MVERIAEIAIEILLGVSITLSLLSWGMVGRPGFLRSLRWALSRHA